MLGIRRKLAVVAGVSLVGSVLMAPGVAAPTTGRLAGWGYNAFGQLGDRTTNDSSVPVTVDGAGHLTGKRLAAISAGRNHSCAIADGAAYCWGANDESQLGTGNTSLSSTPVPVDTSSGLQGKTVTAISAGRRHSCAVADGSAYCWGDNGFLQLGTESPAASTVPVAVYPGASSQARQLLRSAACITTRVSWPMDSRTAGARTTGASWAMAPVVLDRASLCPWCCRAPWRGRP